MHTALQNCPVAAPTLQALARMPLSCTAQHVALTACQLTMRAMRHRCCQGHALATTLPGRVMQRATMRTKTSCVGNYTSPAQGPHVPSASARTRARLRRAAPRSCSPPWPPRPATSQVVQLAADVGEEGTHARAVRVGRVVHPGLARGQHLRLAQAEVAAHDILEARGRAAEHLPDGPVHGLLPARGARGRRRGAARGGARAYVRTVQSRGRLNCQK